MTGNASGTSVPLAVTLLYAHSGTAPFAAKIVNQTRNVKFLGVSQLNTCFIDNYSDSANIQYVEFAFIGSGNVNRKGLDNYSAVGTAIDSCSFHDAGNGANFITAASNNHNNIVVTNCGFFSNNGLGVATYSIVTSSTNGMSVNNCVSISGSTAFYVNGDTKVSTTNLWAYGAGNGYYHVTNPASATAPWAINNLYANSNSIGFNFAVSGISTLDTTIYNLSAYRNVSYGFQNNSMSDVSCNNWTAIGNTTAGMIIGGNKDTVYFNNLNLQGGTTLTQIIGLYINGISTKKMYILSSTLGTITPHSVGDISGQSTISDVDISLINTTLGSTNKIVGIQNFESNARIGQQNTSGVLNANTTSKAYGILSYDTVIYNSSPVSMRMTPNNATFKLRTNAYMVGVASGNTAIISVKVRKSVAGDGVAYNGNQPRLILLQNLAAGATYATDIVAVTASGAAGTWETLTYTLPTSVSASTGLEFYLDCDGTAGWVNIDNWNVV